jgi:hypothetical protein
MKTSELTGNALCYAVCMAQMPYLVWGETIGIHHASNQIVVPHLPEPDCYSPFTTWAMCGPIIEREKIAIAPSIMDDLLWVANVRDVHKGWDSDNETRRRGLTPLIAAMRCFITSKLGDEIDIPEELK